MQEQQPEPITLTMGKPAVALDVDEPPTGVKIAPCSACGHVRQISKATLLCERASCIKKREER